MATITIKGENPEINLPDICPVCLKPATRTISVLNRVYWVFVARGVEVEFKYCDQHHEAYQKSLWVERLLGWIALIGCIALGAALLGLLGRFVGGHTQLCMLIFLCFAGAGFGFVGSAMVKAFLRMLHYHLVPPRYKTIHDALRVKSFDGRTEEIDSFVPTSITFTSSNEEYARLLAEANQVKVEY